MTSGTRRDQRPPASAGSSNDASSYEPPRVELLGTVEEITLGSATPGIPDVPDMSPLVGTIPFASDWRLKDHIAPVDPRAVLRRLVG
jgi:hypothetical protein